MKKINLTIYKWALFIFLFVCGRGMAQYQIIGANSAVEGEVKDYNVLDGFGNTPDDLSNIIWSVSNVSYRVVSGNGTPNCRIEFISDGNAVVEIYAEKGINLETVTQVFNVTVEAASIGTVSITSGPVSLCQGTGTSDYNARAANASSYLWSISPSGAGTIDTTNGIVTWNPGFSGLAKVSVTAFGPNDSSSGPVSRNVTVRPLVQAPPLQFDGGPVFCSGSTIRLYTPPAAEVGLDYTLFDGNGTSYGTKQAQNNNDNLEWSVTKTGLYHLEVSDPNGSCGNAIGDSVLITINGVLGKATGTDVSRCGSGAISLNASPGTNADKIRWYTTLTGGSPITNGVSANTLTYTTSIVATKIYYAESYSSSTGCFSPTRKAIQALIDNTAIWYADSDGDGLRDPDSIGQEDCGNRGEGWTLNPIVDKCPDWADKTNVCDIPSGGPSDQNYVYTRTYQVERETSTDFFNENDALIQQITYFDGLGRPMQQIGIDQSIDAEGEKKDIVTHIGYDDYGRQHRDWLPITDGSGTFGGYKPQDMEAATRAYYKNHENYGTDFSNMDEAHVNAYSEKYFEPSPLNRVLKQAAPGDAWALAKDANGNILPDADDHSIGFAYSANSHDPLDATNTAKDNVRLFKVITAFADNTYMPTLVYGDYGTGDPVGYYAQNELYKTITKDENHTGDTKNHTTEEFTDKQGRVVLKRTYGPFDVDKSGIIDTEESELPFDTYYVYDNYGNLTYVLPPKMEASTATLAAINTNMVELGYQYIYDHRNRLVEKRIPGKEWEYIIYNKLDQPIMTQDANQRAKEANSDEWLFTKYDAFGRVAYTGKARAPEGTSREEVQSDVDSFTDPLWVEQLASGRSFGATTRVFYNNGAYPNNDAEDPSLVALNELLTINYYDNYDFLDSETGLGLPAKVFDKKIENHNNSEKIKTRGLATGSKVKVLTTNQWITTVTGYDAKGRAIFGLSKNPYLGTLDRSETLLDFVGKPLKTKISHFRDTDPTSSGDEVTITTIDNFTYDHVGRLLSQTQCIGDETMGGACPNTGDLVDKLLWDGLGPIDSDKEATNSITIKNAVIRPGADGSATTLRITNGSAQELIVFNTYDALGQLTKKKVGGVPGSKYDNTTGLQEVAYKYNVRGWLTQINDPGNTDKLFNFGLSYNDPKNGATPLFNGNISETAWRTDNDDDSSLKYYSYSYDPLNRIIAATDNTQRFGLSNLRYDKNGNITDLTRGGHLKEMPDWDKDDDFGTMDQLDYQYFDGSNRLRSVTDGILKNDTSGKGEFVDGNKDGDDYVYDPNGNMTQDLNKGIKGSTPTEKGIEYNHLNLPTLVRVNNDADVGTISYIYDATGVKLRKNVLKKGETTPTGTDYAGNYIYENDSLKQISHPEGYIEPDGTGWQYVYRYKDIWFNTRVTYADDNGNGQIDGASEIRREQNYYPFGLEHKGYNTVMNGVKNNLKTYQGQEFTEDLGLNTHEWKYRVSDPAIGRFWQIDPLAEDYMYNSTYAFSENKLGMGIELEGLESVEFTTDRWSRQFLKGEITEEEFKANHKAAGQGALAATSLIIPGPEDLVVAGIVASKIGGPIIRGLSKLFGKSDEVVDAATATKKVPNPNGKKGGEAHQNTMKEVENDLKTEGFDKIDNEVMVKTPDGEKSKRFIDVQGTNTKTGEVQQVQVGKQNKNGTPIARERRAINDVEKVTNKKVEFIPYNKNN